MILSYSWFDVDYDDGISELPAQPRPTNPPLLLLISTPRKSIYDHTRHAEEKKYISHTFVTQQAEIHNCYTLYTMYSSATKFKNLPIHFWYLKRFYWFILTFFSTLYISSSIRSIITSCCSINLQNWYDLIFPYCILNFFINRFRLILK